MKIENTSKQTEIQQPVNCMCTPKFIFPETAKPFVHLIRMLASIAVGLIGKENVRSISLSPSVAGEPLVLSS